MGSLQNLVSTNLANLTERGHVKLMNNVTRVFLAHEALNMALRNLIAATKDRVEDQDMDFDHDQEI